MTTTADTKSFDFTALIDGVSRVHPVRVVTLEGNPWFVAADTCKILFDAERVRLFGSSNFIQGIAADERRVLKRGELITLGLIDGDARLSSLGFISESGLYKLIMRSDKPQARPFQDWVTREVLPSIRKTGAYALAKGEVMPLPLDVADAYEQFAKLAIEHAQLLRVNAKTDAEARLNRRLPPALRM